MQSWNKNETNNWKSAARHSSISRSIDGDTGKSKRELGEQRAHNFYPAYSWASVHSLPPPRSKSHQWLESYNVKTETLVRMPLIQTSIIHPTRSLAPPPYRGCLQRATKIHPKCPHPNRTSEHRRCFSVHSAIDAHHINNNNNNNDIATQLDELAHVSRFADAQLTRRIDDARRRTPRVLSDLSNIAVQISKLTPVKVPSVDDIIVTIMIVCRIYKWLFLLFARNVKLEYNTWRFVILFNLFVDTQLFVINGRQVTDLPWLSQRIFKVRSSTFSF